MRGVCAVVQVDASLGGNASADPEAVALLQPVVPQPFARLVQTSAADRELVDEGEGEDGVCPVHACSFMECLFEQRLLRASDGLAVHAVLAWLVVPERNTHTPDWARPFACVPLVGTSDLATLDRPPTNPSGGSGDGGDSAGGSASAKEARLANSWQVKLRRLVQARLLSASASPLKLSSSVLIGLCRHPYVSPARRSHVAAPRVRVSHSQPPPPFSCSHHPHPTPAPLA